jgi:hypothetical protein
MVTWYDMVQSQGNRQVGCPIPFSASHGTSSVNLAMWKPVTVHGWTAVKYVKKTQKKMYSSFRVHGHSSKHQWTIIKIHRKSIGNPEFSSLGESSRRPLGEASRRPLGELGRFLRQRTFEPGYAISYNNKHVVLSYVMGIESDRMEISWVVTTIL